MADPFQPRFVDLVRNLTSTTGTGNFVLGSAVSGFTSFATAVLAGESFYYSAIGIDKPAEREVGRGTMQADGTISRAPINGTLTNFTPGTKSLALIAAAEWFTSIQDSHGQASGLSISRSNFIPLINGSGADIVQDGDDSILTVPDSGGGDWWASAGPLTEDFVAEIEAVQAGPDFSNWPLLWLSTAAADSAAEPAGYRFIYAGLTLERGKTVSFLHRPLTWDTAGLLGMEGKLFLIRRGDRLQYWAGETLETAVMAFEEPFTTDPLYLNVNSAVTWSGGGEGVYRFSSYDTIASSALSDGMRQLAQSLGRHLSFKAYNFYPDFRGRLYLNSQFNAEGDNSWVRFQNTPTILPDHSPYFARFHSKGNEWQMGQINALTNRVLIGPTAGAWQGVEFTGNQLAHSLGGVDAFRSDDSGIAVAKRLNLSTYVNATPEAGDVWRTNDAVEGDSLTLSGSVIANGGAVSARSPTNFGALRVGTTAGNVDLLSSAGVAYLSARSADYTEWRELRLRGSSLTFHTNDTLRGTLSDSGLSLTGTIAASNLSGTNTGDQFTSMTSSRFLGRVTAGFGTAEELTSAQAATLLPIFTNALQGLAPASGGGTANFLRADGTWAAPAASVQDPIVPADGTQNVTGHLVASGMIVAQGASSLGQFSGVAVLLDVVGGTDGRIIAVTSGGSVAAPLRISGLPVNIYDASTGLVVLATSTAGAEVTGRLRLATFTNGSPANGDIWFDGTKLKKCEGGATSDLDTGGGGGLSDGDYGDITVGGSGTTMTIDAGVVTYAKMQDVSATARILGRSTAGAGPVEELTGAQARSVTGVFMALGFHCAGKPSANEVIGGVISPYAFTINQANSAVKALVAATASTVITIRKNGTQIGTATFAAAGTSATMSITTASVVGGDHITFHAPATADSTLADIDGLLRE